MTHLQNNVQMYQTKELKKKSLKIHLRRTLKEFCQLPVSRYMRVTHTVGHKHKPAPCS